MDTIAIKDIERIFEVSINQNDGIVQGLVRHSHSRHLDMFPFVVENDMKYQEAEVFYQKCLDKDIPKELFEKHEYKFHHFIETLALYNDVYVQLLLDKEAYERSHYVHLNKSKFKRFKQKWFEVMEYSLDRATLLESLAEIQSVSFFATRDISPVIFYFLPYNIILFLDGLNGIVYFKSMETCNKISEVVRNCQLYLT